MELSHIRIGLGPPDTISEVVWSFEVAINVLSLKKQRKREKKM